MDGYNTIFSFTSFNYKSQTLRGSIICIVFATARRKILG